MGSGDPLDEFQERIGYRFRNLFLLKQAITHPSYINEHPRDETGDNQRLEFLGDAVLDFVAGTWIYHRYPHFSEGQMTRLRAALVCSGALARLARQIGLGCILRLGRGEDESGGRERDTILGDAFEALVGALYLDGGIRTVTTFVEPLVEPLAGEILSREADVDAKSRLQEWSQGVLGVTPRYRIVAEMGPDHARTFVAEVLLGDRVAGQGTGSSKQAAEQAAARAAWAAVVGN